MTDLLHTLHHCLRNLGGHLCHLRWNLCCHLDCLHRHLHHLLQLL
ncbi:hypothetical protein MSMEI_0070 [Mycolicibacterium smegmatis MC2 155]|uniref:Uncharacterized protein n=1 Tax=Mycolicibacterium smegmatis (strain ATCC 700084 / mc(2)155) TaxID=246196 RepID=I7FVH2_MYCS2|nr:hypothetical protein MSMEI_0070 [Mycolicibacterium smegmatis MC2 155]